jgi:DNA-binding Xre family transcriptional regulator
MQVNTDKIRLMAARQGLNLGRLAAQAGRSRQTLSTVMTRKTCRTDTVMKLCEALGVEAEEIIRAEAMA